VASYDTGVIQLLTLTPQAIYSEYTLYCQNISYNQAQKYNIFLFSASGKKNRPSGKAGKKLKNK
jgi:hypothetical protein